VLERLGIVPYMARHQGMRLTEPLGYLDMLTLKQWYVVNQIQESYR
jgi:hypothetical protein